MTTTITTAQRHSATSVYIEAACETTTASLTIRDGGNVWILCTSVKTGRRLGYGKSYADKAQALANFKSGEMRAIINSAFDYVETMGKAGI